MSLEAWGDESWSSCPDGMVPDERAEEMFTGGLVAMREMLARFVEQSGHDEIANSMRLNWNPSWGEYPGRPTTIYADAWETP